MRTACKRCSRCCSGGGNLLLHKSEKKALQHFRKAGVEPKQSGHPDFFSVERGHSSRRSCVLLSEDGVSCATHADKPLICKQHPIAISVKKGSPEPKIFLDTSCPLSQEHVRNGFGSAMSLLVQRMHPGEQFALGDSYLTQAEIDSNPFLKDAFDSAVSLWEKHSGRVFKRMPRYGIALKSTRSIDD